MRNIFISSILFTATNLFLATHVSAQETEIKSDPTQELIRSSLSFFKQKLKESNLTLNEQDAKLIKRSGNTFHIPSTLRLKGIASIPVVKEQIRVHQIRFNLNDQEEFGYKIIAINKNSIFKTLGLKKGDVLYQVNGRKINNDQVANEIFNDLKSNKEIRLNLIRENKDILYTYIFN